MDKAVDRFIAEGTKGRTGSLQEVEEPGWWQQATEDIPLKLVFWSPILGSDALLSLDAAGRGLVLSQLDEPVLVDTPWEALPLLGDGWDGEVGGRW